MNIDENVIPGAFKKSLETYVPTNMKQLFKHIQIDSTVHQKSCESGLWDPPGIPLAPRSSPGRPQGLKGHQKLAKIDKFLTVFSNVFCTCPADVFCSHPLKLFVLSPALA